MKTNKFPIIITFIVASLFGVIIGISLSKWSILQNDFFNFTLIDILDITLTIVIALVVTYYIRTQINYNMKKREILVQLIDRFQVQLKELYTAVSRFLSDAESVNKQTIISEFKTTSIFLNSLLQIADDVKAQCDFGMDRKELENAFFHFKESVTDTPFERESFDEERCIKIHTTYFAFDHQMVKCKLSLFQ